MIDRKTRLSGDHSEKGWTFIESIIVVSIILVLTSAVGIAGMRYVDRARTYTAKQEIAALGVALDGYYLDCGNYPSTDQGLEALWSEPDMSPVPAGWSGPYVARRDFDDPWGRAYLYSSPGPDGLPYRIASYGADAQEGGEGKNADVVSWED